MVAGTVIWHDRAATILFLPQGFFKENVERPKKVVIICNTIWGECPRPLWDTFGTIDLSFLCTGTISPPFLTFDFILHFSYAPCGFY